MNVSFKNKINYANTFFQGMTRLAITVLLAAGLTGCVSHSIDMSFYAHRHVNPDAAGQSLPVQVKIFQLKNDLAFVNASFDDLWQQGQQALGETWLSEKDITLLPHTSHTITLSMNPDAEYIAFMGVFRSHHGKTWRVIRHIPHFYFLEPHYSIVVEGNELVVKQSFF